MKAPLILNRRDGSLWLSYCDGSISIDVQLTREAAETLHRRLDEALTKARAQAKAKLEREEATA